MTERLTLATATGLPFLILAFHFATGLIAIVAGFVASAVRKGGTWHRRSGLAFVYAMLATGVAIAVLSAYEGKSIGSGLIVIYLVFTAWTAVNPLATGGRQVNVALMLLAFALAALGYPAAFTAFGSPGHQLNGVPAGMMFFMNTIILLAAIGDARMIRAGGFQGARRLARHLWRMSFALFIASGSFFLGQMKFIPERIRFVPPIIVLAISPLGILLYWMWRIRLRQNLRGMMTAKPIEAPRLA